MLIETEIQQTFKGKNILIGVLNWGLGHATRMVPIINSAIESASNVVICANGNSYKWLKSYYPNLNIIELNAPEITYGKSKWTTLIKLFKLSSSYPTIIASEKNRINNIVSEYKINLILSDNRPGVYNNKVHSIYITHQLNVKAPFGLSAIATKKHSNYYKGFNEVWIPDFEEDTLCLAGDLSRNKQKDIRVKYIGPQSRFNNFNNTLNSSGNYNLAIISGPEPQRSKFENQICREYKNGEKELKIIRGVLTNEKESYLNADLTFYNSPADEEFIDLVVNADKIFCRSGYSTIMDLYKLGKLNKAIFYPTSGQSEQEYLAKYYTENR